MLRNPGAVENPFFSMVPAGPATLALVGLSSAATVIASQALISGAFSLTRQAMHDRLLPPLRTIRHTRRPKANLHPPINWILAAGCLLLVVGFGKSERLASAYGIAVTGTMALTSVVYYVGCVTRGAGHAPPRSASSSSSCRSTCPFLPPTQ